MYVFVLARVCILITLELYFKGNVRVWKEVGVDRLTLSKSGKSLLTLSHRCKCRLSITDNKKLNNYEAFNRQLSTSIYHVIFQKVEDSRYISNKGTS